MTLRVRLRIVVCVALLLATVGPTMADQADIQRYYESMKDICRTGVTPEMTAAWQQARKAMEASREANNFAGIKTPTETWLDCFQSPGDGKE